MRITQPVSQILVEPPLELPEFSLEFSFRFYDQLGGGTRCRCAQIGYKISNRKINFMANGGNGRNPGSRNGTGNDFFVERPQIFERTATTRDDDHIHEVVNVELINSSGNFLSSAGTLNSNRTVLREAGSVEAGSSSRRNIEPPAGKGGKAVRQRAGTDHRESAF